MLPVAVMGPVMGKEISGANHIIQRCLDGQMPGYPNMYIPIVDVRDVAGAHVAAMTAPSAAGQRFLISSGEPAMAMKQIGAILKSHFGEAAQRVPTRTIPNVVVRLAALFNAEFRPDRRRPQLRQEGLQRPGTSRTRSTTPHLRAGHHRFRRKHDREVARRQLTRDFMSRSSDRLRSPGEGPRQTRPTTPGRPPCRSTCSQALSRRSGTPVARRPRPPAESGRPSAAAEAYVEPSHQEPVVSPSVTSIDSRASDDPIEPSNSSLISSDQ